MSKFKLTLLIIAIAFFSPAAIGTYSTLVFGSGFFSTEQWRISIVLGVLGVFLIYTACAVNAMTDFFK